MRTVEAARDPLLHQETPQIAGIATQVDRWNLDCDNGFGFGIDREIDMAAVACVDFPDDPVAIEHRPRIEQRRQRQLVGLREHLVCPGIGHLVDPDQLEREVVVAATRQASSTIVLAAPSRSWADLAIISAMKRSSACS